MIAAPSTASIPDPAITCPAPLLTAPVGVLELEAVLPVLTWAVLLLPLAVAEAWMKHASVRTSKIATFKCKWAKAHRGRDRSAGRAKELLGRVGDAVRRCGNARSPGENRVAWQDGRLLPCKRSPT